VGALVGMALLLALGTFGAAASATVAAPAPARTAALPCSGASTAPNGGDSAVVDAATLCLMNQVRAAHGLHPLRANRVLATIATGQAGDMVRGDYFSDQSLSGQTPLARIIASGYSVPAAHVRLLTAQNIGWGTGPNATPAGMVKAWMQSPPHRRIILTAAYRDAGVGVSPSVPSALGSGWLAGTYAVEFGARR
jgi:uncharacterized protein YkwD